MRSKLARTAAMTFILVSLATPAFAHGNDDTDEDRGHGWGRSGIMVEFKAAWKSLLEQQKSARAEFRAQARTEHETEVQASASCMKPAVEKRENAVSGAFDSYHASVKTALAARKSSLLAAWDKTDGRREAMREAWRSFKTSFGTARTTFVNARGAAWSQFETDRKACGSVTESDDSTDLHIDVQL